MAAPPPCSSARASASCSDFAADSAARAEASWLSAASRASAADARPCSASTRRASAAASASRRSLRLASRPRAGRANARCRRRASRSCSASRRALLLGPGKLRARRFERRFRDPSLGAHCRLPREQLGERRLGFARRRLLQRSARSRSAPNAPPTSSSRRAIARSLSSSWAMRPRGIALQRFLARDVRGKRPSSRSISASRRATVSRRARAAAS